jgi:endonuclease G
MAILSEKAGVYHAIGFWVEHRDDYGYSNGKYASSDVMKTYAVSIDKLEQLTGLDFFCNLPDDVENQVESIYGESDWTW